MYVIQARNVNHALPHGINLVNSYGIDSANRNSGALGSAIALPMPVCTHYTIPYERVIFWPQRDANPFFHLMESLWMLAGRNDATWLLPFNKQMAAYSKGKTFHGAYGFRWRKHFGEDQLPKLIKLLRDTPTSRRAVLVMSDPRIDLYDTEKDAPADIPCNTQVYFRVQAGELQMTVTCRSNDMVWGAYGANAVHFSYLHEYMARMIGVSQGTYFQISNNFHAYNNEHFTRLHDVPKEYEEYERQCPYMMGEVQPYPLMDPGGEKVFDRDLLLFMEDPTSNGFVNSFFSRIAKPMYWAHVAWRNKEDPERFNKAADLIKQMPQAADWTVAARNWLQRRQIEAETKAVQS